MNVWKLSKNASRVVQGKTKETINFYECTPVQDLSFS